MERTLIIFKPSAVQRGLVGEIMSRFERKGLKMVALKMVKLTPEILAIHYSHLLSKPFYPHIEASMMASPVVLCALEGINVVEVVREMTGVTNGRKAFPGTIRGDFSVSNQENIIHASDTVENAEKELARFFVDSDYVDYDSAVLDYLYSKDEL